MRRTLRAAIVVLMVAGAGALTWRLAAPSPGPHPLSDLAKAVGTSLPFEARLTGGFAPSDGASVRRSATGSAAATSQLSPDVLIATAEIEKRAIADAAPQAMAALGVAYLVRGDVDRAIGTLSDAASELESPAPWSDLSAAYLIKATRVPSRRIEHYARALDAASRSLGLSPSNEARYNRALALAGLAPFIGEPPPWEEYLRDERDPAWVEAARRRQAVTTTQEDAQGRWHRQRRALIDGLRVQDHALAVETARLFPEAVAEYFEQEQMVAWARSTLGGAREISNAARAEAQILADAIHTATGDPLPREGLGAIAGSQHALAAAHLAYAEGLTRYDGNDYPGARAKFMQALSGFARAKSPFHAWTRLQLATIQFQERLLDAADAELASIEGLARARGYPTLLGRTLWLRGLVFSKQWRLSEALAAFRDSAQVFEAAGEQESAVSLYHHLADTLRTLGERQESWEYIGRTLEGLSRVRKPVRRYLSLYNAALFASSEDLLEAALVFQNATVREAQQAHPEVVVDAITQRAVIHLRRDDRRSAANDLGLVRAQMGAIAEGPVRRYLEAELNVISAQAAPSGSGHDGLESAIAFFAKTEPARVPRLFLTLARTVSPAQGTAPIEQALATGIARLEALQARLDDESLKVSYFDESWDLFPEMIQLQLADLKKPARAFEYAERSRARSLLATLDPSGGSIAGLEDIQSRLPPSVGMIYYVTLADRLLIWSLTSGQARLIEVPTSATVLGRLIRQYRQGLIDGRDVRVDSARLFDLLIRPAVSTLAGTSTLVVVPDGDLQRLPFATLRDSTSELYLIEERAIVVAPSASFFAAALPQARRRLAFGLSSALLVGNPATRTELPLPGADEEAAAASRRYPHHELLRGETATKDRFLRSAPDVDVIHFGGHAVVNPEYPLLSRLVLAAGRSGTAESLYAHEIARVRLPRPQLVVLAACSTAAGAISRGEGAMSLARPFLGAGIPLVIASQWDVDDRTTAELFGVFHQQLAVMRDPVQALRTAQLALLRGATEGRTPAAWGAFVAMGTTTH